jgi:hypothetical protein
VIDWLKENGTVGAKELKRRLKERHKIDVPKSPYMFEKYYQAMATAKPEAIKWLQENHNKLWTRSQFSTLSEVDYVTNNLAETFNKWVKLTCLTLH